MASTWRPLPLAIEKIAFIAPQRIKFRLISMRPKSARHVVDFTTASD